MLDPYPQRASGIEVAEDRNSRGQGGSAQHAKAMAEAVFGHEAPSVPSSLVEQDAVAAQAKIARLKGLREAREKAEADRAEAARDKARRAKLKPR